MTAIQTIIDIRNAIKENTDFDPGVGTLPDTVRGMAIDLAEAKKQIAELKAELARYKSVVNTIENISAEIDDAIGAL